jgi:methionine-S-sulfoxide reductase
VDQACFAAGCFWGVQFYFDQIPGVVSSTVGYTGGTLEDPTYEDVCYHQTGHAEAVLLEFNPDEVSFEALCKQFFRMHNPTQLNRQGPDVGDQYRSAIFLVNEEQRPVAEAAMKAAQSDFKDPIVTQLEPLREFYQAEPEHQKYAEKTGRGMCHIPYKALD